MKLGLFLNRPISETLNELVGSNFGLLLRIDTYLVFQK